MDGSVVEQRVPDQLTNAEQLLLFGHLLGAVATAISTVAYALRLAELGRTSMLMIRRHEFTASTFDRSFDQEPSSSFSVP